MNNSILQRINGWSLPVKLLGGFFILFLFSAVGTLIAEQLNQLNYNGTDYAFAKVEDDTRKAFQDSSAERDFTTVQIQAITGYKLMVYHVVVGNIEKAQVEPTTTQIIDMLAEEDSTIDEMIIHFYSDETLVEQGETWDIASAIWGPEGVRDNITASIAKNDERNTYKTSIQYGSAF